MVGSLWRFNQVSACHTAGMVEENGPKKKMVNKIFLTVAIQVKYVPKEYKNKKRTSF